MVGGPLAREPSQMLQVLGQADIHPPALAVVG
jgi:hypothetical protein